jgi:hypothetical protein
MSEDRDPALQALFAGAQRDLEGSAFTAQVMTRSRFLRYRLAAPWVLAALSLLFSVWYFALPADFSLLIARALTTELLDLGSGWLSWVLAPVNNIASLLILGYRVMRLFRNRILSAV